VPIADLRTNRRKSQGLPPARSVTVGSNPTRRKIAYETPEWIAHCYFTPIKPAATTRLSISARASG